MYARRKSAMEINQSAVPSEAAQPSQERRLHATGGIPLHVLATKNKETLLKKIAKKASERVAVPRRPARQVFRCVDAGEERRRDLSSTCPGTPAPHPRGALAHVAQPRQNPVSRNRPPPRKRGRGGEAALSASHLPSRGPISSHRNPRKVSQSSLPRLSRLLQKTRSRQRGEFSLHKAQHAAPRSAPPSLPPNPMPSCPPISSPLPNVGGPALGGEEVVP
jgi:hypothetical protein